jgi:hypothetical protein
MSHRTIFSTVTLLRAMGLGMLDARGQSATNSPTLPVRKLMDMPLRDPSVCRGPDGRWYLTGTVEPFLILF